MEKKHAHPSRVGEHLMFMIYKLMALINLDLPIKDRIWLIELVGVVSYFKLTVVAVEKPAAWSSNT